MLKSSRVWTYDLLELHTKCQMSIYTSEDFEGIVTFAISLNLSISPLYSDALTARDMDALLSEL